MPHTITIVDHGKVDDGFIEVYVDDEGVITYPAGAYEQFGSVGFWLRSGNNCNFHIICNFENSSILGHASFGSFEVIPLQIPLLE